MPSTYDYRKLRGRIREKLGTQAEFSALEILYSDIHAYFFTHAVEKNPTIRRTK